MKTLFTIGHSNHTLEEFISLLKTYNINVLVDIRTIPKSRHVPWFNKEALSKTNSHNHELTTFAVVDHSRRPIRIYYPEDKQLSLEL